MRLTCPRWRALSEYASGIAIRTHGKTTTRRSTPLPVSAWTPHFGQTHIPASPYPALVRYYTAESVPPPASVSDEPTIFALSTAPGKAAIAVLRISGPACVPIYQALCPNTQVPKARYAAVRSLYSPNQPPSPDTLLDPNALVLYFPAPRTVTGEDVLELHVHGGPAIVKAVLRAIGQCASRPGAIRYAEPGEFTRRAFLNDRLDLTQVEALGDSLSAMTEQQRKLSVRRTTNNLSQQYETWRSQLLHARGELEALIDFSEDQHFDESPVELTASVAKQVRALTRALRVHISNAVRGELLRNGISVSLLGAPNAGKSSLLNRVLGREAAIVSQEAGTTRDVVEVGIDLGGYLCRLGDTAGLRMAEATSTGAQGTGTTTSISNVEREGMRRAKARALESDVVIVVLSLEPNGQGAFELKLDPEVTSTAAWLASEKANLVLAVNKTDQESPCTTRAQILQRLKRALPDVDENAIYFISCLDAEGGASHEDDVGGIRNFLAGLVSKFEHMTKAVTNDTEGDQPGLKDASIWQESLGASERHRLLLDECVMHLDAFLHAAEQDAREREAEGEVDLVLAAEYLRTAAECLARITGRGQAGDVEEVLGVVFEKFCVGK